MRPRNLTAEVKADPMLGLAIALPGGIEASEARGQGELVRSESLPTNCRERADLETAGVKFGEPYPDDPIFCQATLPSGWTKKATHHSMWSHLIDEKGRKRASIFYKAAFYDRSAHMRVECRYGYSAYEDGSDKDHLRCVVRDGETVIHDLGERRSTDYESGKKLEKAAEAWLAEHFPDWRNPAAYWD